MDIVPFTDLPTLIATRKGAGMTMKEVTVGLI